MNLRPERKSCNIVASYIKKYMPGIDGNVSMRLDEKSAVLTPTGVCKGFVTEDQLLVMSLSVPELDELHGG